MRPLGNVDYVLEPSRRREVLESIRSNFRIRSEPSRTQSLTYYDTFDWRLHRKNSLLAAGQGNSRLRLTWSSQDGLPLRRTWVDEMPDFASEVPDSGFQARLRQVTGIRRLLPAVELKVNERCFSVVDDQDKAVARVRIREGSAAKPGKSRRCRIAPRLQLWPVRGYQEAHQKLAEYLEDRLRLPRSPGSEFLAALRAIGRKPDYTSKFQIRLDPESRADQAAKAIHRVLLEMMLANEDGVRRDLDAEFLHDFRVAVRRTRSALGQIKGVYPAPAVERFREEFSWLGGVTGPSRDLDVYLLKMDDYCAALPGGVREDLQPLREFLEDRRRKERASLVQALDSNRYRRLTRDWSAFLETGPAAEPESAARPVREVASRRISRVFRKVSKISDGIDPESPAADLHRLRIECKKVRYLLEFFSSLYPEREVAPLVKGLKRLQDHLGDLNDLEVHQRALQRFALEMAESSNTRAATLLAIGRLLEQLELRKQEQRKSFPEQFSRFDSKRNKARFRKLFHGA